MKKQIFHNQWNRDRKFPGLKTTQKSMTMPGQAVTAQEIIRAMTVGVAPQQIYHDQNLDSFHRMDPMEKIDYLTDLAKRNIALTDNIQDKIARLHQQAKIKEEQDKKAILEAEIRAKIDLENKKP